MKRSWYLAAALLLAVVLGLAGLWRLGGDTAPEVEFVTLKGERIALRTLRGHPVLVSFWASDCPACLAELADLAALHGDYAARGLRLIAVAMPYDPPNRVVEIAASGRMPYPVALDPLGRITQAFGGIELVPNAFLIDPDGRIALHRLGRLHADELRAPIERLLTPS